MVALQLALTCVGLITLIMGVIRERALHHRAREHSHVTRFHIPFAAFVAFSLLAFATLTGIIGTILFAAFNARNFSIKNQATVANGFYTHLTSVGFSFLAANTVLLCYPSDTVRAKREAHEAAQRRWRSNIVTRARKDN
ncbi:uncharacterized protein MONBRDRAFT_25552 [Monosiga brevicollis MX1]|uniref:Uncharacterized protein n=1 Tax=Monosiga brevicollis TaxID=81824 RepID=A9UZR7_MONBE|nr:uncharacterized protein MONBRDRAFT_25552 [Monosiga brevicollis MX1]EDQ89416.1 predicted protein [Monosiga brevicollis MX1]|eukprot:XP_001745992.1 hypothetical protein [Monosiga brevicollis MX1]